MSAPTTLAQAQSEGWDDDLLRCIECGSWFDSSETDWTRTEFGPRCEFCDRREQSAAERTLARMGMTPVAYKPRCRFGRAHTWLRPASADEDQDFCTLCGVVSSIHPISREGSVAA